MADVDSNATLDGINGFTILGQNFNWNGSRITNVDVTWADAPPTALANLSLSGSNWRVEYMKFSGLAMDVNITDADANLRVITLLTIGDGNTTINLKGTAIRDIRSQGDGDNTITLGTAFTNSIRLGDGTDIVTVGSGGLNSLVLGSGNATVTTGSGFMGRSPLSATRQM